MHDSICGCSMESKPKSLDEKLKAGESAQDGLGGATEFREESYEPYKGHEMRRQRIHNVIGSENG